MTRIICPASAILAALLILTSCGSSNSLTREQNAVLKRAYETGDTFSFKGTTIYNQKDVDIKVSQPRGQSFSRSASDADRETEHPWGNASMSFIIDSTGTPIHIMAFETSGYRVNDLTRIFEKMIKSTSFTPAINDGKPVNSMITIEYSLPKIMSRFR